MTPDRTLDIAVFLHSRLHKSKKILVCKSDMELAQEIMAIVNQDPEEE
jgi:hypothetical protein